MNEEQSYLRLDIWKPIIDDLNSALTIQPIEALKALNDQMPDIRNLASLAFSEGLSAMMSNIRAEWDKSLNIALSESLKAIKLNDELISDALANSCNALLKVLNDLTIKEELVKHNRDSEPIKAKERLTPETKRFIIEMIIVTLLGIINAIPGFAEMFQSDEPQSIITNTTYNIQNYYSSGNEDGDNLDSETLNNEPDSLSVGALSDDESVDSTTIVNEFVCNDSDEN